MWGIGQRSSPPIGGAKFGSPACSEKKLRGKTRRVRLRRARLGDDDVI